MPPFGDKDQLRVAHEARRDAFWQQLAAGHPRISEWPEFQRMFARLEVGRGLGTHILHIQFLDCVVDNLALLGVAAEHLSNARVTHIVRGALVRARVRMKSSAVEASSNVKLWGMPSAIRSVLGAASRDDFDALAREVGRVKALPTSTKRAVKRRELAKKMLRSQILAFARRTFEGESLERITTAILESLKVQSGQTATVVYMSRAA